MPLTDECHWRGLLKTDQPAPTDKEVTVMLEEMLEERRVEKYLFIFDIFAVSEC